MMVKRSLFFLLACLVAVNIVRVNAKPISTATVSGKGAHTVERDQSVVPISIMLNKGALQIKTPVGSVLSGIEITITLR